MNDEEIEGKVRDDYSRMALLGLREISKKFNPFSTMVSLVVCVIAIIVITKAVTKWGEINEQSIRAMDKKIITDTVNVVVRDTINTNDCDTVFIIDGMRFRKAQ